MTCKDMYDILNQKASHKTVGHVPFFYFIFLFLDFLVTYCKYSQRMNNQVVNEETEHGDDDDLLILVFLFFSIMNMSYLHSFKKS